LLLLLALLLLAFLGPRRRRGQRQELQAALLDRGTELGQRSGDERVDGVDDVRDHFAGAIEAGEFGAVRRLGRGGERLDAALPAGEQTGRFGEALRRGLAEQALVAGDARLVDRLDGVAQRLVGVVPGLGLLLQGEPLLHEGDVLARAREALEG